MVGDAVLRDNLLQALDRLYDQRTNVIDVQALIAATAAGLQDQELARIASRAAADLEAILGRSLTPVDENRQALIATDELRHMLA